ncbi:MAG: thioredoxin family protein [Planctomycetaceae bacterium]|nr:thioredoxin family protein [Planctomycetaceae bacterium]
MVKTASTMLPLGTTAPDFSLINVNGQTVSLSDFELAKALIIVFMCNHCPFVKHIAPQLAQFARDCQAKDVALIGINSNDVSSHPGDSPEQMIHEAEQQGYTFPYLFDETQEVAIAYRAACTPDFFLFDSTKSLVYRGQFDSSRPDSGIEVTGADLQAAVDTVLNEGDLTIEQIPSIGCNIKWKAGAEPDYFNPAGVS